MEEIGVGDYIRTNKGTIGQIIEKRLGKFFKGKDDDEIPILRNVYELDTKQWTTDEYIVKHSKDIIDLIEVGDCVNGNKVMTMCYEKKEGVEHTINFELENGQVYSWKEKIGEETHDFQLKIETILTYEQYEQNCYKVGED